MKCPLLATLAVALGAGACGGRTEANAPLSARASSPAALFVETAREVGLDFVHFNGMSGSYYFPEMMGGGGAFVDYDGDGDLDVFLVQGSMLLPSGSPPGATSLGDRLYRNDLEAAGDGTPILRFTDVTGQSGLSTSAHGMGVASGDYDNDGRVDLYVTRFGRNSLLHNDGGGAFSDRTAEAGVQEPRWSVAATFFDFDRDGWLDLYVGNYLDYTLGTHRVCRDASGAQDYCGPQAYAGTTDRLFRNRGDGRFEDVTVRAGLESAGRGLGVVASDLDADGWQDLYVANDGEANALWHNLGDGRFRDVSLLAGCALNVEGRPQASMGVDVGDYDGDGDDDLFMTHLREETHALFRNEGGGSFVDASRESGLAAPSFDRTGFGTAFFDYDNDGWLDVVAANGAVHTLESLARVGDPYPLHQRKQLFHNRGDGTFEERTAGGGAAFATSEVGRGLAVGDVDNDGDPDVLVVNNNGPVRLLCNEVGESASWIGLRLVGVGGRDMLGARAAVRSAAGAWLWRRVGTDGSYAAASDPRLLIGLGRSQTPVDVRVHWPDGVAEAWRGLPLRRYTTLQQGRGDVVAAGQRE